MVGMDRFKDKRNNIIFIRDYRVEIWLGFDNGDGYS